MTAVRAATLALLALAPMLASAPTPAGTAADVQSRIDADLADGKPVVVHLVVALCDNVNQGIVPVPEALGNGQDPASNVYWGALYGVRTHLPRSGKWARLAIDRPDDGRILDRVAMYAELTRRERAVPVYIVADAWDGATIREATQTFLDMAAGRAAETVTVTRGSERHTLSAGGGAHVVAYIGHDGLMDFSLESPAAAAKEAPARSAVVLACASKSYFLDHLRAAGAHPLLLTTGLMAPEAYTLDAALRAWIETGTTAAVTEGAAEAYHRYQKCGLPGARRLFWGQP